MTIEDGEEAAMAWLEGAVASIDEGRVNMSPAAMSLEAAYGSVKPSGKPEDFKEIAAIAKQAKAEETARESNDA